jgi:hypothetical protein
MFGFLKRKPKPAQSSPTARPSLRPVERPVASSKPVDEGFDSTGFAVGMMTGIPLSPAHGFSTGAMLGAALHSEPERSHSSSVQDYSTSTPSSSEGSAPSSSDGSPPSSSD